MKAKRIELKGIRPVKKSTSMAIPAPSRKSMDEHERKWRAEDDARTLAQAAAIAADKKRAADAKKAAQSMAKDKEAEAQNLRAITKKGAF